MECTYILHCWVFCFSNLLPCFSFWQFLVDKRPTDHHAPTPAHNREGKMSSFYCVVCWFFFSSCIWVVYYPCCYMACVAWVFLMIFFMYHWIDLLAWYTLYSLDVKCENLKPKETVSEHFCVILKNYIYSCQVILLPWCHQCIMVVIN